MRRIRIFLILCVIATGFCFGQLPHTFTQYTSEDGLSQNTIMSILQDDKGVMVSTNLTDIHLTTIKPIRATASD